MNDSIRIKLTSQEATIVAELFSNGDPIAILVLLAALPKSQRHRLSDKIRTEMEHAELNILSARAYLDSRSRLHIEEARE